MKSIITFTILFSFVIPLFSQAPMVEIEGRLEVSLGSNMFIGPGAGEAVTDGTFNAFVGPLAGFMNTSGSFNTFLGVLAGFTNNSGSENTFLGYAAGTNNTSGQSNTFIGKNAGNKNQEASSNTFLGEGAGQENTTGHSNTFVGMSAGNNNNFGYTNTFIGQDAGYSNTSGLENTFIGQSAGYSSKSSGNTFIGRSAGSSNISGDDNMFAGLDAGKNSTSGSDNTFLGARAGENNTGTRNTYIGKAAGLQNSFGGSNTFVGAIAGLGMTAGEKNTFVGLGAGSHHDIYTNCTFLGYDADQVVDMTFTNSMALGYESRITSSNSIAIGNSDIGSIKGQVSFTTFSDSRYKKNVQEDIPGLEFIRRLRPVSYQVNATGIAAFLGEDRKDSLVPETQQKDTFKTNMADRKDRDKKDRIRYSGFLAQEVEQAATEVGFDFSGLDKPKNEHSLYGLRYAEFVVPLVKGMQEQQVQLVTVEQRLLAQDVRLEQQGKRLSEMQAQIDTRDHRIAELEAKLYHLVSQIEVFLGQDTEQPETLNKAAYVDQETTRFDTEIQH